MAKYIVSWKKTPAGNGIEEGGILTIKSPGAISIAAGVYKNGLPYIIGQVSGSVLKLKIQRKGFDLKGIATLKTEIYSPGWARNQINDQFVIY